MFDLRYYRVCPVCAWLGGRTRSGTFGWHYDASAKARCVGSALPWPKEPASAADVARWDARVAEVTQ